MGEKKSLKINTRLLQYRKISNLVYKQKLKSLKKRIGELQHHIDKYHRILTKDSPEHSELKDLERQLDELECGFGEIKIGDPDLDMMIRRVLGVKDVRRTIKDHKLLLVDLRFCRRLNHTIGTVKYGEKVYSEYTYVFPINRRLEQYNDTSQSRLTEQFIPKTKPKKEEEKIVRRKIEEENGETDKILQNLTQARVDKQKREGFMKTTKRKGEPVAELEEG